MKDGEGEDGGDKSYLLIGHSVLEAGPEMQDILQKVKLYSLRQSVVVKVCMYVCMYVCMASSLLLDWFPNPFNCCVCAKNIHYYNFIYTST